MAGLITLRVRSEVEGPEDDFGNPTYTWVERDWPVRSIAPGSMEEPGHPNRDLSLILWTVYADAGEEPTFSDEVRLPGGAEWFTVEGEPSDWTMGPPSVGPYEGTGIGTPGVVVELKRAEG